MATDVVWTEARFRAFIVSALRKASSRWPVKYQTMKEACVGRTINTSTGKMALHYKCAGCCGTFSATAVAVDHIQPVVEPKTGFVNWDTFIARLFCNKEGLQVLCKVCHDAKTATERKERKDVLAKSRVGNSAEHGVADAEGRLQKPPRRPKKGLPAP